MTISNSFLGKGFSFPFRLNAAGTAPSFSSDEQQVKESIDSILSTGKFDRPFRAKRGIPYGVGIQELLFENTNAAMDVAKFDTRRALTIWEPRIIVQSVSVSSHIDPVTRLAGIAVLVNYRFRATNRNDNFVKFYSTAANK